MQIGEILAELAKDLPLEKKEALRIWGNQSQLSNSFVSGLQNGGADVFANTLNSNTLPFFPIYTQVLASAVSSLTIPIPTSAKHLFCIGSGRCTGATFTENIVGTFNGDTGNNYDHNEFGGTVTTPFAQETELDAFFGFGLFQAASATAGAQGSFFSFMPHIRSGFWKSALVFGGVPELTATTLVAAVGANHWRSTDPITSITISAQTSTIEAGSVFAIFGFG